MNDQSEMQASLSILKDQYRLHLGVNLLDDQGIRQMHFSKEMAGYVLSGNMPDEANEGPFTEVLTEMTLKELFHVNQYYRFDPEARNNLRSLYSALFHRIRSREYSLEELEKEHYQGLAEWLKKSQPVVTRLYQEKGAHVTAVVCEEYSAVFQCHMLGIDTGRLMQPVLDLGCGEEGRLVHYLREQNIEAYGCDRLPFKEQYLFTADWMEYRFIPEQWGTIISHMAFSNHFVHHHYRLDGDFSTYASKYMELLKALKFGGSFYYCPGLPFIEEYLSPLQYRTEHGTPEHTAIKSTRITRIQVNE